MTITANQQKLLDNQAKRAAMNNGTSTNNSNSSTNSTTTPPLQYINNPDGTPVNATTATTTPTNEVITNPASGINIGTTPASAPVTTNVNVSGSGKTTPANTITTTGVSSTDTSLDAANKAQINAQQQTADVATAQANSQVDLTKSLSETDASQAATRIADANANQSESEAIQQQQVTLKTQNELERQAQIQADADAEVAALRIQQASENVANAASVAELKAKNDAAEFEMETQNNVALMQSNVSFAKLGLSFSGAAINTAQSIFTSGVYNLAKLKTGDAANLADLQVKVASTEFAHIQAVNKIISDAHDKEYESKESLREFIGNAQNNILLSKKEAQKTIQDAITTYKTEQQSREDKLYSTLQQANSTISSSIENMQKIVTSSQTTAKTKIDGLIASGQWLTLSPAQKVALEQQAGVPVGSTSGVVTGKVTQMLSDSVKDIVGKTIAIPSNVLASMQTEVNRQLALNVPLVTAVQFALSKYSNSIPEVSAAKNASKVEAELNQSKIDLNKATADAKLITANAATTKAQKSGSGSGGSGATKITIYDTIQDKDGKWYDRYKGADGKLISVPSGMDIEGKLSGIGTTKTDSFDSFIVDRNKGIGGILSTVGNVLTGK